MSVFSGTLPVAVFWEICYNFSMQIDEKLIMRLEGISCLALSETERNSIKIELQEILNNMGQFNAFDPGNAVPNHTANNVNVFRADHAELSFSREFILANAPVKNDQMFIAPKTVEWS